MSINTISVYWRVVAAITLILILAQVCCGMTWAFDREQIRQGHGELLVTAHFVHLNSVHFLLNLMAWILIALLFEQELSPCGLAIAVMVLPCLISAAIWHEQPHIQRYVGFSGVLHGIFALGVGQLFIIGREKYWAWLLACGLILKLVHEQYTRHSVLTEQMIGGSVLVDAHLYGAYAGLLLTLIYGVLDRFYTTKLVRK